MAKRGPKKGNIPWNKGKKLPKREAHSEETRAKISAGVQAYVLSDDGQKEIKIRSVKISETIQERFDTDLKYTQRISQGMLKHYQTDDGDKHRQQTSEANMGNEYRKNKTHSPATKERISLGVKRAKSSE